MVYLLNDTYNDCPLQLSRQPLYVLNMTDLGLFKNFPETILYCKHLRQTATIHLILGGRIREVPQRQLRNVRFVLSKQAGNPLFLNKCT